MNNPRRKFMNQMATAAMGTAVAPLGAFYSQTAEAARECADLGRTTRGFGNLRAKKPENTRDLADIVSGNLVDRDILALPRGFSYTVISGIGQTMNDGNRVPGKHDGMGAFQKTRMIRGRQRWGRDIYLVRNHEIDVGQNIFGETDGVVANSIYKYDAMVAAGGTTTVVVDSRTGLVKRHYVSLAGTIRNCSGGTTPWNTWITCEEDIQAPIDNADRVSKPHGFNFEVPAFAPRRPVPALPLRAMGRFRHESTATDPRTTNVFQTEDRDDSCFYAFVPRRKNRKFGHLRRGGALYAMAIRPNQRATCDNSRLPVVRINDRWVVDTRKGMLPFVGQPLKVTWVKIDDPAPVRDTVRREAQSKGGAIFRKGEGMVFDDDKGVAYFCASKGGDLEKGQIWCYDPVKQTVTLVIESVDQGKLDVPDNIVVGPDGTIYMCEESSTRSHVVGMTGSGRTFRIVRNLINTGELTGVCFSPNKRMMFVNVQDSGLTCCIFRDDGKEISLGT